MIRALSVLFLTLALAACGALPSLEGGLFCSHRPVADLPVRLDQGAVLVPARINGVPVQMEVDTGAMTTLIAGNAASVLRLPADPQRGARLHGTGGTITTRNALVDMFEFGGVTSPPRSIPTGPLARTFLGGGLVAGIVGASDLAQFDVELDVLNRRMTLWSVTGCAGRFARWDEPYHVIPLTLGQGGLMYTTVQVNGQPVRAMIDWGARSSQLTLRAARRIGVTDAMLANDPAGTGHGIDQTAIALRYHRFEDVRVGPEIFRGLRISVGDLALRDADMLLGMDYARTRRLWLSYATQQMFVAPRRRAAPATLTPRPDVPIEGQTLTGDRPARERRAPDDGLEELFRR